MTHDRGQRSIAQRALIAIGAMLGASVVFVGVVMLLLSVIVQRVVEPAHTLPASDKTSDVSEQQPSKSPRASTPIDASKVKVGDRS